MAEKKPTDLFIVATENGVPRRTVSTLDLQVGYPGRPAELHLTGKVSNSLSVVELKPGQTHKMDDSITVLCVKRNGTGSGVITVTLPSLPRVGQLCQVKDASGTATSNNIVVSAGSTSIDGSSTRVLTNPYEFAGFVWVGDGWVEIGGYDVGINDLTKVSSDIEALNTNVSSLNSTDVSLQSQINAKGFQAEDQQAWQSSGTQAVTAGSWNLYGPTYTFVAPIAKTYVVNYRCNAYLQSQSSGLYSLYVRIKNTTTGLSYSGLPNWWTVPNAGTSQSYCNVNSEVAVPMVAGNNVLQFELFPDAGATWQLTTTTYRAFLVRD